MHKIPGTKYIVLGTRFQVPDTHEYEVHTTKGPDTQATIVHLFYRLSLPVILLLPKCCSSKAVKSFRNMDLYLRHQLILPLYPTFTVNYYAITTIIYCAPSDITSLSRLQLSRLLQKQWAADKTQTCGNWKDAHDFLARFS